MSNITKGDDGDDPIVKADEEDDPEDPIQQLIPLSKEEIRAVILTALGLNPDEVGIFLIKAPSTIRNQLHEAHSKLGVKKTIAAFVIAQLRGWIQLADVEAARQDLIKWRKGGSTRS